MATGMILFHGRSGARFAALCAAGLRLYILAGVQGTSYLTHHHLKAFAFRLGDHV
ncbi:MAG: hypothetical protein K0R47_5868, partial [Brevibacillus sp.]|nr:hypothetical protein [Brevibacillus sp.]